MSENLEISLSELAYCKMLLHCAKYPHLSVNGVLLASKTSKGLVFEDCVPLFHICLNVTPMYEIAMTQIDIMAEKRGLVIAGYYSADNIDQSGSEVGMRIASKIGEYSPKVCWFVIDNEMFPSIYEGHKNGLPFTVMTYVDGKWCKQKDRTSVNVSEKAQGVAEILLVKHRDSIVDFDNHFDDLKKDWKNPSIAGYIAAS